MLDSEINLILKRLLEQMEQAESIEDCLILIEDLLDEQKPEDYIETCVHRNGEEPYPQVVRSDIPPGEYVGSSLIRSDGGSVERRFSPILLTPDDTLDVTWRFGVIE